MAQVFKLQDLFDDRQVESSRSTRERSTALSQSLPLGSRDQGSDDEVDDYWPDVSSRYALERPQIVNPANSLRRVLFETFLIFAGAGALVLAVSLFVPQP
jgi:hypothetical protein